MANIKDQNRLRKVYSFYRAQPVPLNLNITNNLSGGGLNQNQLVGVWIDAWPAGSQMTTTGSIAIKAGAIQYASQAGSDVWFYVSGSGAQDRSVFATTALFSASLIASNMTGSLTRTAAGLSYLVGGSNIAVTSQSNGQVIISATTSVSGTGTNNPWIDGNNKLKASSSVSIDSANHFATDYGTDVWFYVSGSSGVDSGANRHVVVLPDTFISGASISVGQGPVASSGSIRLPNKATILVRNNANTADLNIAQYDGGNNLLVGDGAGGTTSVYGNVQLILFSGGGLIAIEALTDIYMDARTITYRDAAHGVGAVMAITASRGVSWSGGLQPSVGTDAFFYVSGSIGLVSGVDKHITVFGSDVLVSGSISGSIQKTAAGASYLVAGTNVSITSASNGQVTINAALGNGSSGWVDGVGKMKTTGSISIDASNRYADALGTDVFFFVSGSVTSSSTSGNRKVAMFGGDVVTSGGFFAGSTSKEAMPGKALAYLGNRFGVAPGGDAALYLLGPNNLAGSTNYSLLGSDAGLEINTYGTTLYFEIGTTAYAQFTANSQFVGVSTRRVNVNQSLGGVNVHAPSGEYFSVGSTTQDLLRLKWIDNGAGSIEFDPGKTSVTLQQNRSTTGNAANLIIAAQQSLDGAFRGGDIILSGGIGGGVPGFASGSIIFKNGGVQAARFTSGSLHLDDATTGSYPTTGLIRTPFYPALLSKPLWMGLNSVSASANIISQNGNSLFFGDNSATNGWSTYLYGYSIAIQGYSGVQINSQIQPTDFYSQATAQSWRFFEYATSNPILTLGSVQGSAPVTASFGALITASIGQAQSTSGRGANLTLTAQQGANIGLNLVNDGGATVLQGGSPTGTSFRGAVRMQLLSGSTADNMVEAANVVTGSRVLALVTTSSLTNVNMPTNTGDLVVFISNAATLPTTSSAGGGILYNNAGALTWYSPGGTQTVLAPNDPHCPKCGRDWVATARNTSQGWKKAHCFFCLEDALAKIGISPDVFSFDPDWNQK